MTRHTTRHCESCQFRQWQGDDRLICTKGHRPRFYQPVGRYPRFENDWGWKRRCADYQTGDHVQFIGCNT